MRTWLKDARERIGLSQAAVADKVSITQQHYSLIENGERQPSVKVAKEIASVLNFDWIDFWETDAAPDTG